MDSEDNRKTRLQKLKGSDFTIADGEPDIRGWDVLDTSGKQLGEVDELIFDYQSRKVRYLVVDLDDNDYDLEDRKVLVPIGIAELHEKDDDVILPNVSVDQIRSLPEYDEDRFDTEHETNIRNVFGGLGAASTADDVRREVDNDFYDHHHFDDRNLYRNRRRSTIIDQDDSSTGTTDNYREAPDNLRSDGMRLNERNIGDASHPVNLRSDMEDRGEYDESGNRKDISRDYD